MPQIIGFWQESFPGDDNERWPHSRYFVGQWDDHDKKEILEYMAQAVVIEEPPSWDGYKYVIHCQMCGFVVDGSIVTDGQWQWPATFSHYVEKHDIVPPKEFVDSIRDRKYYFPDVIEIKLAYGYSEKFWRDYTAQALKQTIEDDKAKPGKKQPRYSKV